MCETGKRGDARVAQAAGTVALGNLASRLLGFALGMVRAYLFGSGGDVSALTAALRIPIMIYDLLVGGVLSSAFVPVLSEYATEERRAELWHVLSSLITVTLLLLVGFVLVGELLAPQLIWLQAGGLSSPYRILAVRLLRLALPAVLFLSLASVLAGALYALKRFALPAFIGAAYNAATIGVALLLGPRWGVASVVVGTLAGAVLQVVLQLPGVRDARLRPALDLYHPALKRIGRLYLPIVMGLAVDKVAEMLSYRLASGISDPAIAWMANAAQIIQFPLGLVVAAVSIAILPTLSQQAEAKEGDLFRSTLARGLRLVLFLVIPSTVGLYVLATPVVRLVFERGAFMPSDTLATAEALRYSLLGLLSAAVDQPLIFAFYARKNTLAPALVGVGTTLLYVLVAVGVLESGLLTLPLLVLLNALKLAAHALAMLVLTRRHLGGVGDHGLYALAARAVLASAVMLPLTWVTMRFLTAVVPSGGLGGGIIVCGAGGVGAAVYGLLAAAMGIKEIGLLRDAFRGGLDRLTGGSR